MASETIREGITHIQQGNIVEGMRLLRIGVRQTDVPAQDRAVGYWWLATYEQDPNDKANCYRQAYELAPHHPGIRQAWERFRGVDTSLPSPPTPAQPQKPVIKGPQPANQPPPPDMRSPGVPTPPDPNIPFPDGGVPNHGRPATPSDIDHSHRLGTGPLPRRDTNDSMQPLQFNQGAIDRQIVGIFNTATRPGTGFFITKNGLIATTRHLVGSLQSVTVELQPGHRIQGKVVRSFPSMDLALIQVDYQVAELWPHSQMRNVPDDAFLRVLPYRGEVITGRQRPTKRQMARHWFATTITRLPDAGGDPIFDEGNYLLGMLTRNISRNSDHVHGVLIAAIREAVEGFVRDFQFDSNRAYCPHCGFSSRAVDEGFFYCELCGAILPHAVNKQRIARPQSRFHIETETACPHCEAYVGFHDQRCLRCGRDYNAPISR
ncbi:MAG: hypothetical protein D6737_19215 [Chloroflexi bacterium]|nr:MAG: hypothetical protein D6737_19215 [Chloroflexota bacterium]